MTDSSIRAARMLACLAGLAALWLFALPAGPAWAQGSQDAGGAAPLDLQGGFSDALPQAPAGEEPKPEETRQEGPPFARFTGFVRLDGAYNYAHKAPQPGQTDWRGLSMLQLAWRPELSLALGGRWDAFISAQAFYDYAYAVHGREHYADAVLDAYQQEGEFREVWLRGTPLPRLDVKLGRQIVVWGKSDTLRVTDVLNPLDNRQPGMTDLEDLRLPVTLSRVDYYLGRWSVTAVALHEVRFDKNPVPGSDFFPAVYASLPPERVPADGGANTQYGLSLGGLFTGWDLALYWAQFFDRTPHLALLSQGPPPRLAQVHGRLTMAGAAASMAAGNWLLKSELARFTGLAFYAVPGRTFSRVDALLGTDYSGITDTTLTFEAVDRHILSFEDAIETSPDGTPQDVNQYVLGYRGSFLHQKLDLVAVLNYFGGRAEQGSVQRYSATYELAEALKATGGVVIYTPGDGKNFLLVGAQDNDRVFFELKWSY
jgi:hypothetical protein